MIESISTVALGDVFGGQGAEPAADCARRAIRDALIETQGMPTGTPAEFNAASAAGIAAFERSMKTCKAPFAE
jgi:hypothetical protein